MHCKEFNRFCHCCSLCSISDAYADIEELLAGIEMKCMANVTTRPYEPGTSIGGHLDKEGRGPRTWTEGYREFHLLMIVWRGDRGWRGKRSAGNKPLTKRVLAHT